jgi:thiol-disulfide isomerase/thioredoxin
MIRCLRLLTVALAFAIITGCTNAPAPRVEPTATAPAGTTPTVSEADLEAAKQDAGIADCPESDPDVVARTDGLPDITLDCLGGGRVVRLAGLRGKPTVINLWAQWCRPCRQEAPHLAALSEQAGDKINFIGVDYQDPDPVAAIEFARQSGWRYPQLQDQQQVLRGELGIIGIPTTILVDADGRIQQVIPKPFSTEDQLRQAITEHLGVAV